MDQCDGFPRCDAHDHSDCPKTPGQMKLNCSLLRTCRKINLEARDFILSSNAFIFAYYVPLIGFLYALGPKKASLLRSIQLNMSIRSGLDELFWDQALR